MIATIIIFILSIAVAKGMIARKVWKIRAGQIVPGPHEEADWTHLSLEAIRTRLIEVVKFGIHHFVLFMLKIWIITSNWVRRADRNIKEKLMHALHKNAHYPAGGKPSGFLKRIRDHKDEVVQAIKKDGEGGRDS